MVLVLTYLTQRCPVSSKVSLLYGIVLRVFLNAVSIPDNLLILQRYCNSQRISLTKPSAVPASAESKLKFFKERSDCRMKQNLISKMLRKYKSLVIFITQRQSAKLIIGLPQLKSRKMSVISYYVRQKWDLLLPREGSR